MRNEMDCGYLGAPTGETHLCPTCKGTVRLKVFDCVHPAHGQVTVKDCEVCSDYLQKPQAPSIAPTPTPPAGSP